MQINEILFEEPKSTFKPGKYDWIKDKESSQDAISLAGKDLVFTYKNKEYKFKPVVDAAKKLGSLYKAGRGGKKDSPIRPVVKAIQAYLAKAGLDPGPIDGYYGKKTAKAVVQLQRKLKVTEDGDVGPNTATAMVEEFKNFTVAAPEDSIESNILMADNWFSKHTKFSSIYDFFEAFKTRYLSLINGFEHLKSNFPKPTSETELEIRKAVEEDLDNAASYIQMHQNDKYKDGLTYKDPNAWKDLVQIYSNFPLNKKQIQNLYNDRQGLQQKQLDKWQDDQLGKRTSSATGTRMSKGSAVDQYEPKKPDVPRNFIAPNAIKLSQPDIPDYSKYLKK